MYLLFIFLITISENSETYGALHAIPHLVVSSSKTALILAVGSFCFLPRTA